MTTYQIIYKQKKYTAKKSVFFTVLSFFFTLLIAAGDFLSNINQQLLITFECSFVNASKPSSVLAVLRFVLKKDELSRASNQRGNAKVLRKTSWQQPGPDNWDVSMHRNLLFSNDGWCLWLLGRYIRQHEENQKFKQIQQFGLAVHCTVLFAGNRIILCSMTYVEPMGARNLVRSS